MGPPHAILAAGFFSGVNFTEASEGFLLSVCLNLLGEGVVIGLLALWTRVFRFWSYLGFSSKDGPGPLSTLAKS